MASVESVTLAGIIKAIRAAAAKAKLTNELEDSLQQLDSIVKLLVS
jgi:hypothetical protein